MLNDIEAAVIKPVMNRVKVLNFPKFEGVLAAMCGKAHQSISPI